MVITVAFPGFIQLQHNYLTSVYPVKPERKKKKIMTKALRQAARVAQRLYVSSRRVNHNNKAGHQKPSRQINDL